MARITEVDLQPSDPIFNEIRKHPLLEKKRLLAMLADHDKLSEKGHGLL